MNKKAVLLIHGFGGGTSDLEYLFKNLQLNKRLDVFLFTLPGHEDRLKVKATKGQWIKSCEEEIEWLIANGYKKIYVIGHSMGGVLATNITKKYKQIKKLVLLAPAFRYLEAEGDNLKLLKSLQKGPEIIKDYPKVKILSNFILMPISTVTNFINLIKECYEDPKYIDVPILTIHGKKDKVTPMSSAEYVHNSVKSKTNILIKMDNADHGIANGKRRDEVCILVNDFLKFNLHVRCKKIIEI